MTYQPPGRSYGLSGSGSNVSRGASRGLLGEDVFGGVAHEVRFSRTDRTAFEKSQSSPKTYRVNTVVTANTTTV